MDKTFSLDQLLFAAGLMDAEVYLKLLQKHGGELYTCAKMFRMTNHYIDAHQSNLFSLLKSIPRNDKAELNLLSVMINDLVVLSYT